MYLRLFVVVSLLLLVSCKETSHTTSSEKVTSEDLAIWPPPQRLSERTGQVSLDRGIYISPALSSDEKVSGQLRSFVNQLNLLGISSSDPKGLELTITSHVGSEVRDKKETYDLSISESGATLSFWDYSGLQYGLNTLSQILYSSRDQAALTALDISDYPTIGKRGVFLDVVSHWFPMEVLLSVVDQIALARFNTIYLHVSDDQAYRLQSKLFDKLNTQSSRGENYSITDINKLVDYAALKGIRIVPSIDVPGHVGALVSAYPELGLSDQEGRYTGYGIQKAIINPAAKNTIPFLKNLIAEITEMFHSDEIHLGGGEVRYDLWLDNPEIIEFIEEAELTHPQQLHGLFTIQLYKMMEELDKVMILWDAAYRPEIKEGKHISYMAQDDHRSSFGIADKGHPVISGVGWSLDKERNSSKLYAVSPYVAEEYFSEGLDKSVYLRFDLTGDLAEQEVSSMLVILGEEPTNLNGYVSVTNKIYPFEGAQLNDTRLIITSDDTDEKYQAEFNLSDANDVSGVISLAGFSLQLNGKKTGGSDMTEGLELPELPETPRLARKNNIKGGVVIVRTAWMNQSNIRNKIRNSVEAIGASMWNQQEVSHSVFMHDFQRYQAFSSVLTPSNESLKKYENSTAEIESPLPSFLSLLEEISEAKRFADSPSHNANSSLSGLVDAIPSESLETSRFETLVETVINQGSSENIKIEITKHLDSYIPIYRAIKSDLSQNAQLRDMEVLALSLSDLAKIAKHVMESGTLTAEESEYYRKLSANAQREINGISLGPAKPLIKLINSYRDAL